jgi:hypothetical protein
MARGAIPETSHHLASTRSVRGTFKHFPLALISDKRYSFKIIKLKTLWRYKR